MKYAFVKDKFVPAYSASISIQERGFRFGDGVFETIRISSGVAYQWELHCERLISGLLALKIEADISELEKLCTKLIRKNKIKNGILRISISRGIGSNGYFPTAKNSTIIIETSELPAVKKPAVNLWLSSYEKISLGALPVNTKLMQGVSSTLARLEADQNNCHEALLLNRDKHISECSSSNIFWFRDDYLFTPELSCGLVAGTTRSAILRISPFEIKEGKFSLEDILSADEIFLCNVAWQIISVQKILPVGSTNYKETKSRTGLIRKLLTQDIKNYAASKNN